MCLYRVILEQVEAGYSVWRWKLIHIDGTIVTDRKWYGSAMQAHHIAEEERLKLLGAE